MSGYCNQYYLDWRGTWARYWSSTKFGTNTAYPLYIINGGYVVDGSWYRIYGLSVRDCFFRSQLLLVHVIYMGYMIVIVGEFIGHQIYQTVAMHCILVLITTGQVHGQVHIILGIVILVSLIIL